MFNLDALIAARLRVNRTPDGQPADFPISESALHYIYKTVKPKSKTLETGCGKTTVVFAMLECNHTFIDPSVGIPQRLFAFCKEQGVQIDTLYGINARSEDALPNFPAEAFDHLSEGYDFVLIDGRHSFPTPFVDFYYAGSMLKVGGLLMLDDVQIWSVEMLTKFLDHDKNWRVVYGPIKRHVVYEKLGHETFTALDSAQPFWRNRAEVAEFFSNNEGVR